MKPECSTCQTFPCMVAWMDAARCPRWKPRALLEWIVLRLQEVGKEGQKPLKLRMHPDLYAALYIQLRANMPRSPPGVELKGLMTLCGLPIVVDRVEPDLTIEVKE